MLVTWESTSKLCTFYKMSDLHQRLLEEEEKNLSRQTPRTETTSSHGETSDLTEERTNEENWWFGHKFESADSGEDYKEGGEESKISFKFGQVSPRIDH